jgi:hypothetical protein
MVIDERGRADEIYNQQKVYIVARDHVLGRKTS